jgi:hypothetical protein
MPVSAAIKFTQGVTTDTAGRALVGGLTTSVTASNGDNSGVEFWEWETIDVPPGSTVPVGVQLSGTTPTFSFTPDRRGGYHVSLRVRDAAGNESRATSVFQVLEESGRRVPPFSAAAGQLNFAGQLRGWAPPMEEWLRYLDGQAPLTNASTGTINDAPTTSSGLAVYALRLTGIAPTVTGFASGYDGRRLYVYCTTTVVFSNEGSGSAAANRILTGTGDSLVLRAGSTVLLVYDATSLRWRVVTGVSGPQWAPVTRTAITYATLSTDYHIAATASGITITLLASPVEGRSFEVSNNSAADITVSGGGVNIAGVATEILPAGDSRLYRYVGGAVNQWVRV